MSGALAAIHREAKGTHQALKEALKTREPWDREVDFQRRNLRRQYLHLLLAYSYAKESKDAETYLWMQTSYTFIAMYKQRIHALQRAGNAPPPARPHSHQQQQHNNSGHGTVEYRKFLQRFRQFLAEEERFWQLLVVRFCRSFALDEAQPVLVALGILPANHDIPGSTDITEAGGDAHHNATTNTATTTTGTTAHGNSGNNNGNGRGHPLFPSEDTTASVIPQTPAQRAGRFAILSKALVCLGDIARYRELYNESGGRPKAGQEEGTGMPVRGKAVRGKRGGGVGHDGAMARPRNYDRAQLCYEQARLLVPSEGNASHQLAILASYKKDAFGSLVHYYRALCVRQPYDTASENLGTVLSKALEQWRARTRKEKSAGAKEGGQGTQVPLVPWKRAELLKEKVVVLHALWRLGVEKMDAISPKHAQDIRDDFFGMVSERGLPPDMISKMVILSQGALWKHRMIREPTPAGSPKDSGDDPLPSISTAGAVEARMLEHVLAIHQALMQIGLSELAETPEDAAENDLAQRITAPFRRTLPALRVSSKWLRANSRYVVQSYVLEESSSSKGKEGRTSFGTTAEELSGAVMQFWTKYAEFSTLLWHMFPLERLPVLSAPLEEDVDMRGFLPLRHMMGDAKGDDQKDDAGDVPTKIGSGEGQVHPNEEQLMRITDLLNDAKILAEEEDSLVDFSCNKFRLRCSSSAGGSKQGQDNRASRPSAGNERFTKCTDANNAKERDDDASRTDDDPVRLAFETALDASAHLEDDDNDHIVWDLRGPVSPPAVAIPAGLPSSPPRTSPITPMKPTLSPIGVGARSPTLTKGQSPFASPLAAPSSTTAQDLLNVMGVPRMSGVGIGLGVSGGVDSYRSHVAESSAPQPQLLFGSGPPDQPDHSIWSTTLDNQSIKFAGTSTSVGNGSLPSPSHHLAQQQQLFPSSSSQEFGQSIWSSLYPNTISPSTQGHVPTSTPMTQSSAPFTLPLHVSASSNSHKIAGGSGLQAHQRTLSSSSASLSHLFAGQHQKRSSDDPFLYATFPLGSSYHEQQFHHAQRQQQHSPQLQSVIRPIGTRSYSPPLGSYHGSVGDPDNSLSMGYGHDAGGDYHHGGPAHQSRASHAFAGTPLSSVWGNT